MATTQKNYSTYVKTAEFYDTSPGLTTGESLLQW